MKKSCRISIVAVCAGSAIQFAEARSGAETGSHTVRYRPVPLEALNGGSIIAGKAINAAGVVTGVAGSPMVNPGQHACIWTNGQIDNLDATFNISYGHVISDSGVVAGLGAFCPPLNGPCTSMMVRALPGGALEPIGTLGGSGGEVADINRSGEFVGWAYNSSNGTRPFLFTEDGGLQDLGTLGGFTGRAHAINDARQIVGESYNAQHRRGFVWEKGVMTDIGTLGGSSSVAKDINNAGIVVGWARTANGATHAFRRTPDGVLHDIHTLPGAVSSSATLINDAGMIAGYWSDGDEEYMFIHTETDGMIDIGRPAGFENVDAFNGPIAMNASGAMIGVAIINDGGYSGFSWFFSPEAGMHLLSDLVLGPLEGMTSPSDINDAGQIVAGGVVLELVAPADINADGAVDVDDLIAVILAWGACADCPPPNCPADVNDDCAVDVDDLITVILNWG